MQRHTKALPLRQSGSRGKIRVEHVVEPHLLEEGHLNPCSKNSLTLSSIYGAPIPGRWHCADRVWITTRISPLYIFTQDASGHSFRKAPIMTKGNGYPCPAAPPSYFTNTLKSRGSPRKNMDGGILGHPLIRLCTLTGTFPTGPVFRSHHEFHALLHHMPAR